MPTNFRHFLSLSLAVGLTFGLYTSTAEARSTSSRTSSNQSNSQNTAEMTVIGAAQNSEAVTGILKLCEGLMADSNQHNLEGILSHYSPRFTSGDNLNLSDVKQLIKETWETFPDIKYQSKIVEIRVSGDWATVESVDMATAASKADPTISSNPGKLQSRSRGLLHLHKAGSLWEIVSDFTLFEMATIKYGNVDALSLNLATPEQTFSGESYTAKVNVEVPKGILAIATISKEPLVYPQLKPRDKFRSLSMDHNSLERIFQANTTNNNEIVTATVGFTQIGQDDEERPVVKINGIATLVKRVNVIPRTTFSPENKQALIKESASGQVTLSGGDTKDGDNSAKKDPLSAPIDGPLNHDKNNGPNTEH